jgi:hypothetical protein
VRSLESPACAPELDEQTPVTRANAFVVELTVVMVTSMLSADAPKTVLPRCTLIDFVVVLARGRLAMDVAIVIAELASARYVPSSVSGGFGSWERRVGAH